MSSLAFITLLCKGWRRSQIKTFTALWEAFIQSNSAILTNIARELTRQCDVAVDHTLKRLSRFLANPRIDETIFYQNVIDFVWPRIKHWKTVPIAIDWTYIEKHDPWQSLVASIVVRGRGIPILVWSFPKNDFKPHLSQNRVEEEFLRTLRQLLPQRNDQRLVLLADRGFSRASFFQTIITCGFEYVIRLQHNVKVTIEGKCQALGYISVRKGQKRSWSNVMYRSDSAMKLQRLVVTRPENEEGDMDPWFLASSLPRSAEAVINLYTKRMTIEEDFRTAKSNLNWKRCRIRKLKHYRRFVIFMVASLLFAILIGLAAQRKPSLARKVIRKRKGKLDTSASLIGIRLLRHNLNTLRYMCLMGSLPNPL